jgi:hypothetical protein
MRLGDEPCVITGNLAVLDDYIAGIIPPNNDVAFYDPALAVKWTCLCD